MFILRTTNPTNNQALWEEFDSITREALTCILGSPVDDDQWSQAKLPVSTGGIGLRSAEDHAPAAYLTSLMGCQSLRQALLHLTEEDSQLTISAPLLALLSTKQGEDATVDSLLGVTQKAVGLQIDLHNMNLLIDKHNREAP